MARQSLVDTYPGYLRGYRAWRFSSNNDGLYSLLTPHLWTSATQTATCFSKKHAHNRPTPAWNCTCGLYARYDWPSGRSLYSVEGAIKAHGRIILSEYGFKAEHVTVEALVVTSNWANWYAKSIAEQFKVPLFKSIMDLKMAFPPSNVFSILPPFQAAMVL